jgi:hypothetical protein
MRGGAAKAGPFQRGGEPWRGERPRRATHRLRSKPLMSVADSRVEQDPEGGGCFAGLTDAGSLLLAQGPGPRDGGARVGGEVGGVPNVTRGTVPETANGCTRGAKL